MVSTASTARPFSWMPQFVDGNMIQHENESAAQLYGRHANHVEAVGGKPFMIHFSEKLHHIAQFKPLSTLIF